MADGREIAYRVLPGDGPVIVHSPGCPIDLVSEDRMYDRFVQILASAGRLVLYDDLGVGASDGDDPDRGDIDERAEACVAVLDAVDAAAGWLVGNTLPLMTEIISRYPDRVSGAVMLNSTSRRRFEQSVESVTSGRTPVDEVARLSYPSRADEPAFLEWLERSRRLGSNYASAVGRVERNQQALERFLAEVRPIIDAPPVMLIHRREAASRALSEWWNGILPHAESVTIDGADQGIPGLDAGLIAELAVGFITGSPVVTPAERKLVALLFTDLVDSTPAAATSGDMVWRSTLDRYEATLQRTIQRHHGTVVKHTGDGALATFPSGSEAITAAIELRNTTRDLGLEGRTGIHVGEVEQRGDDIGGIAVHLAARIMAEADPGEILVSWSVDASTLGGRYRYRDLGSHGLKGLEQPIHLFAVELDAAR